MFLSLLFMDHIFRILTVEKLFSFHLVLSSVFLLSIAIIAYLLSSLFKGLIAYIFSFLILGISAFLYASQLIYFDIFKTFYSVYSVKNAAQVMEFWRDIIHYMIKQGIWILLIFLPVLVFLLFGKKFLSFEKIDGINRISFIACFLLTGLTGIVVVNMGDKDSLSAYDLYYNNSFPTLSFEKLGLLTSMRIDLQRQLTHWSPAVTASPTDVPVFQPISPGEKEIQKPEEKKIEYNTMEIDFEQLINNENNPAIQDIHRYFSNTEATKKNEYTGKYKGYNLIFITAEGFSPFAVDKELTPTLFKMLHEGYHFTNFYSPIWGVSTSDGEYVACTGLIPKSGVWSFKESAKIYLPFVMGNQLNKLNYNTLAYHNHTYTYYRRDISHPNMGYLFKGVGNGLNVRKTWPESDLEMMEKTIPEYIDNQPFHAYYMTVSGHLQYNFFGNYIANKNKNIVANTSFSEQARAYLAGQIELDRALEYLLAKLEEKGIADKTLITLSADHYPYGLENKTINELAGHNVERNFELYKNHFLLYTKGMEGEVIDKPASSLDIIPTLSNLLGLEYDSRLLMGKDIFSDSEPLVIFMNKSFITDKGYYNSLTKKFIANDGEILDSEYVNQISSIIQNKFYYSAKILETDYYRKVFNK